jgi:hypothetical protein
MGRKSIAESFVKEESRFWKKYIKRPRTVAMVEDPELKKHARECNKDTVAYLDFVQRMRTKYGAEMFPKSSVHCYTKSVRSAKDRRNINIIKTAKKTGKTLRELGKQFGLSQERIRQIFLDEGYTPEHRKPLL